MDAAEVIRDYYEALRRGEPLYPYFAERGDAVKFGLSERLDGYDEISEGLREQTRTTGDWSVESRRLSATERGDCAWFSDDVRMAWTDRESGERRSFDTRWSGTLVRTDGDESEADWQFVGMHVSAATALDGEA